MSPRRAPAYPPFVAWGVFLAVLTAVAVVFFSPDVSTPALLGGNAAFVLVLALLLAISRRSLQSEGDGADPDASPATVWLALSLVLTAVGAALGLWLVLIGAGMSAVGVAAVVRELRAQRAAAREAGMRETAVGGTEPRR
ncbi:MAG TPA: hypothetical protein VEB65_07435 [Solirubrobacterales bacterium]|nr:hypothetical protein [Solirubrobacterales bacterium]